jgi:hypothetical protein
MIARRNLAVSLKLLGTVHTKESPCLEFILIGDRVQVASAMTLIHAWRWDVLHEDDGEVQ